MRDGLRMADRDQLCETLFHLGMSQSDMLYVLATHGYILSQRHLKRILASKSLTRRKHYTDIADVVLYIQRELRQSGRLHGYRWMWEKCLQNGMKVRRDHVQQILALADPDGTAFR